MRFAFMLMLLLVAGAIVLSFAPVYPLWGLAGGADLPPLVRTAWILAGLAIVPLAYSMERRYLRAKALATKVPDGATFVTLLLLAAAVLFTAFRSLNHYLGDGWLLLGFVLDDANPLERRPGWGTIMLHRVFASGLAQIGITKPDLPAFQFVSSVAGLVYVLAAHRFAAFVARLHGGSTARATYWISFLLVVGAGSMQLFFGYVENYALVHLFMLLFFVEGTRAVHGSGDRRIAMIWFVIAVASHLGAVVFWPAVVYLLLRRADGRRRLKPALGALIAVLFVLFPTISELNLHRMFVSWTRHQSHAYAWLWPMHGIFVANLLLLVLPAGVAALLFVRPKKKDGTDGDSTSAAAGDGDFFLLAGALSGLVFSFSMHPYLGPRDWDLFSLFAPPFSLWAAYRIARARGELEIARPLAIALSAIFLSAGWVIGNADGAAAVKRVVRFSLDDPHHWVELKRHQGIAVAQMLWERDHRDEATLLYEKAAEVSPFRYRPRRNLGIVYWGRNRFEEAKPHLEAAVRIKDDDVPTLYYLASTCFHLEERGLGEQQFRRVLELDPGNPSAASYLGRITMWQGKWEEAKRLLLLAQAATPEDANLNVWLAQTHAALGETGAAIAALERALAIDPSLSRARAELERLRGSGDD